MHTVNPRISTTRRGLTLIDVLVAACVVALLAAILLPARVRTRLADAMTQEQQLARHLMAGMAMYAEQNRDRLMPAGSHWAWSHVTSTNPRARKYTLIPRDPWQPAREIEGSPIKVWTLHYLAWDPSIAPAKIQIDQATQAAFNSRNPNPSSTPAPNVVSFDVGSRAAAFAWHPSLGMNGVFVGGSYSHGAFRGQGPATPFNPYANPEPAPNPRGSGGNFYVQSFARVTRPWELVMFTSARGGDVQSSGAFWNYGADNPDFGTMRPGHWLVRPPRAHPTGRGSFSQPFSLNTGWHASDTYDAARVPSSWGNVAFRYNAQAVTATMDGHVQMQTIPQLRAMNKWAEMAKRADWNFPTNASQIWW